MRPMALAKKVCCLIARAEVVHIRVTNFLIQMTEVHGGLFGVYGYYMSMKTQIL
jgi:hypothetical protein